MPNPARGEVWLADLGYVAKTRPCLVLSVPYDDVERAVFTLAPHTTRLRGTRFEVKLQLRFLKAGAFDTQGMVTVVAPKLLTRLGTLSPEQLSQVEVAVLSWLGLSKGTRANTLQRTGDPSA